MYFVILKPYGHHKQETTVDNINFKLSTVQHELKTQNKRMSFKLIKPEDVKTLDNSVKASLIVTMLTDEILETICKKPYNRMKRKETFNILKNNNYILYGSSINYTYYEIIDMIKESQSYRIKNIWKEREKETNKFKCDKRKLKGSI